MPSPEVCVVSEEIRLLLGYKVIYPYSCLVFILALFLYASIELVHVPIAHTGSKIDEKILMKCGEPEQERLFEFLADKIFHRHVGILQVLNFMDLFLQVCA